MTTDASALHLAALAQGPGSAKGLSTLDLLEAEGIHIIREVVAEFERPVLLFSGGKDSVVVLHLATKAFAPGRVPFPVLHVDTGHNFPEVIAFRDETVARLGLTLEVARVQDYIDDGRLAERPDGTRNPLQTQPLLATESVTMLIDHLSAKSHRADGVHGGDGDRSGDQDLHERRRQGDPPQCRGDEGE